MDNEMKDEGKEQGERKASFIDVEVVKSGDLRDKLLSLLKEGENTPSADPISDIKNGLLCSDRHGQRVVYETGAVPCAILVAINEKGDVAVVHEPMTTNVALQQELSEISLGTLKSLDATKFGFGNDTKMLLTGINVHEELRSQTVGLIKAGLPSYQGEIEERFTDNKGIEKPAGQMFGVTDEVYDGVCAIPPGLSIDGRSKILIVSRLKSEPSVSPADILRSSKPGGKGFSLSLD